MTLVGMIQWSMTQAREERAHRILEPVYVVVEKVSRLETFYRSPPGTRIFFDGDTSIEVAGSIEDVARQLAAAIAGDQVAA